MRLQRRTVAWVGMCLIGGLMMAVSGVGVRAGVNPVAGSQGVDTAIPATDSRVTVNGRGTFANVAITVNQTKNLTNQAISVTWSGAQPTVSGPGRFGSRFLQIMQCWGEDDGTTPDNPGPPPEQCEQGAVGGTYGGLPGGLYPSGFALSRLISRSGWANFDPAVGILEPSTTNVWLPFRAVGGTTIDIPTDPNFNPSVVGGNFWLNPYFNLITTNEIPGTATGPDGEGADLFQVVTGVQSSGLGCGQSVQPVPGAGNKIPRCWLVVVPRGAPADENVGTPYETNADQSGVATSPLSPTAWKNRIAIPLEFNPVDSPCSLANDERRIAGSDLVLPAVASWQPLLCAGAHLPPYSYAPVSDASARQQLVSTSPGGPGMVVVSRPLSPDATDPKKPVVYAPLSVSGLVIGFNIERNPRTDAPPEEQAIAGIRVADLNLTPRLVAKLLTQSYRTAVSIQQAPPYAWMAANPAHLGLDPDFLQFNPEFRLLQIADSRTFSGLQLPAGNSDAAQQLWEWVLADPEAKAWLDGAPDEFGMKVNPVYSTSAAANPNGIAFGDPMPNSFPKADPYCYQAPARGAVGGIVPPPLCGTDWMPYARNFADTAIVSRIAFDGAKIVENTFAVSSNEVWKRDVPQFIGRRSMLSLTDTPSAAQFGLQVARLSRAGDNGPSRGFVAPDTAGLTAGVASMAPVAEPTVLEPAPSAVAPGAYPLAAISYAAISPLANDAKARFDYAAFLDYAAGPGQVPGLALGQLPRGYAPLSDSLLAQTVTAANEVRTMVAAPDPESTTTTTTVAPAPPTTARPRVIARPRPTTTTPTTTTPVAAPPATDAPTTIATATTVVSTTSIPTVVTPVVKTSRSRFAVPGLGIMVLGSALGALEISKRPRRRIVEPSDGELDAEPIDPHGSAT